MNSVTFARADAASAGVYFITSVWNSPAALLFEADMCGWFKHLLVQALHLSLSEIETEKCFECATALPFF